MSTVFENYIFGNPMVFILVIVLLLIFLAAFYFIRKSLQPTENFDSRILRSLTSEDRKESLLYCISFFREAYEMKQIPILTDFMEFRIMTAIVFTFYKKTGKAAKAFLETKSYYYKDRPLPDYTEKYKERLAEDGREGDIYGAFCLYGCEEFSKLLDQI